MRTTPSRPSFRIAVTVALCLASLSAMATERIVGLPCEGCDAVFVGKPAVTSTIARIAPPDEPGEALQWRGRTLDAKGAPVAGVVVYAYHTDASGHYPQDAALRGTPARQHGRLRGWARSDADGRFGFDTIRPAGYPGRSDPAHIHVHVIEPARCSYYIDDVNFRDDPRLAGIAEPREQRGGDGIADAKRDADGTWKVTRDIVLGLNIPRYADCSAPSGEDAG